MSDVRTIVSGHRRVTRQVMVDASAAELFDLLANPKQHGEVDGSGTVKDTVEGPARLSAGAKFSVRMKQFGFPYKITSKVVDFAEGSVIAWRHPMGHLWIWEFDEQSPGVTQVTETFDYNGSKAPKVLELFGFPKKNGEGISRTLQALASRYS